MKYLLFFLLPFLGYSMDFCFLHGSLEKTYNDRNFTKFTYEEWVTFSDTIRLSLYFDSDEMYSNFSGYGIVGDGIVDDTAALQLAFDSAGILVNDVGSTFKISSKLDLDQSFTHTIDWNNATLITENNLSPMIRIDKRLANGGVTKMSNLVIDGSNKAIIGLFLYTRVDFTNVDIMNLIQIENGSSPAGIRIDVYDDDDVHGNWFFDGCDISNIKGLNNGIIGDAQGGGNGILMFWRENPVTATNIIYKNAEIHDCFAEDAQTIAIFSPNLDISNTNSGITFDNLELYNWERRNLKLFASNITFKNSLIKDTSADHEGLEGNQPSAGMIAAGKGSGANAGNNISFINCEFQSLSNGRDRRVIFIDTYDFKVENCRFTGGANLSFTKTIGDGKICNSSFYEGSNIRSYGSNIDDGEISLDTDNVYVDGKLNSLSELTGYSTIEANLSCAGDTLAIDEDHLNAIGLVQNPSKHKIRIQIPSGYSFSQYRVFGLNGNLVKQGALSSGNRDIFSIKTDNLEAGAYIIQLSDNNGKTTNLKWIKN